MLFFRILERDLNRIIPVLFYGLFEDNPARSGFYHGYGNQTAIRPEYLRHSYFFADQSINHGYNLISTSTPAEMSSFIRSSAVCGVGSYISISLLWVLISNCSLDFLST